MDILKFILLTWVMGLVFLLVLQYFVFWYGYRKKRIDVIDVFWGLSFVLVSCIYIALNGKNINIATSTAFICISIWGLRLSSHIFTRFRTRREQDKRYTDITKSFIHNPILVYIKVFAVQALLANLVMTVFMFATFSPNYNQEWLLIGLTLWLFGFVFESIADTQLKKHIDNKTGGLIKTGLWKYSRHPNYFGELVQWWAVWLMVAGGEFAVAGLIGPLSISFLILFVSGIPPLEKHMASKKGWTEYKKSTSMIIPWKAS